MSVYTTELRYIVESGYKLPLDDYPIYSEAKRAELNKKIIDHFYFREIGFETTGLFARHLKVKMAEIMPYYNEFYKSTLLAIDPLVNYSHTEAVDRHASGKTHEDDSSSLNSQGTSHSDSASSGEGHDAGTTKTDRIEDTEDKSKNLTVGSDTPQGMLSSEDIMGDTWASTASRGTTDTTHHGEGGDTTTVDSFTTQKSTTSDASSFDNLDTRTGERSETKEDWETIERRISGVSGISQSMLIKEFRETFLNIDMMIIEELEVLFMGVW